MLKDRIDIENKILNGIMNFESFFTEVYDLNPDSKEVFQNVHNKIIFSACLEYFVETGNYPTAPDIYTHLQLKKYSDETKNHFTKNIIGNEYIKTLNAIQEVVNDSVERKIREVFKAADKQKLSGSEYAEFVREQTDKIILESSERNSKDNRTNEQKVIDLLNNLQLIREGKTSSDYIPTGFKKLDEAIIGLPKSHLMTIASRPGMGKTSFMLQLKRNLVAAGYKPLIISIEMTEDQLLTKDLSAFAKIDSRKIESGNITDNENSKITEASNMLKEENYFIEDGSFWSIEKIKSTIRRYRIKEKIDCVFIDYLTLIRFKRFNKTDRFDLVVGEATNSLREFAKETGLPIVILSQLNRDSEKRTDKKPTLADLRESGSIEQDSKTVLFLFRPEYYGKEVKDKWTTTEGSQVRGEEFAEVIIAKARSGKTGIVPLQYRKEIHFFEDLIKGYDDQFNSIKSHYKTETEDII